jgi:hypothetical protein
MVLALAALTSCAGEPQDKKSRCAELRERIAELSVARSGARLAPEEQAKHRAALVVSSGDAFVRRCVEEWSDRAVTCALEAEEVEGVSSCVARR